MRREVAQLSGLDLPATLVFDYPSTAEMATFVVSQLPPPAQQPAQPPVQEQQAAAEAGIARSRARRPRREKRAQAGAPAVPLALNVEQRLEVATALVSGDAWQLCHWAKQRAGCDWRRQLGI